MATAGEGALDPTAPLFETSALLTIDVQLDVLDGQPMEVAGTSARLPQLSRLCQAFRRAGRPVVHVVRLYRADGSNAEACRADLARGPVPVFRPGTPGSQLAPGLVPAGAPALDPERLLAGQVQVLGHHEVAIYKPRWGAFFATPLEGHLAEAGISTVVVAGCNFPNCPRATTYEASERDLRVVAVTDATSGLDDRGGAELRGIGVHLRSTDEVVAALARWAGPVATP